MFTWEIIYTFLDLGVVMVLKDVFHNSDDL